MEWDILYKENALRSKNHYYLIHPKLPKIIPHLSYFTASKAYTTIISRLKFNHGRFPMKGSEANQCKS